MDARVSSTLSLGYEPDDEGDSSRVSIGIRSKSADPMKHGKLTKKETFTRCIHVKETLKSLPPKSSSSPSSTRSSESLESTDGAQPVGRLERHSVVSSCPKLTHLSRRRFARQWSSTGILNDAKGSSSSGGDSDQDEDKEKTSPADSSSVFRKRSATWAGEEIRPYESAVRCARSDNQGVLIFYLENPRDKMEAIAEINKDLRVPCVCQPSQPPSTACSSVAEEDDDNRMVHLRSLMIWVTYLVKLMLFLSLWALLLYWFLMSAGYVNTTPEPIKLQEEWNTYIDKFDTFKFLPFNNTFGGADLEVRMQGPFGSSNVFFNCQFERLYYEKDKFNETDVRIDDAEAVEVDHRVYEDSYSAITSTTTRRTLLYTETLSSNTYITYTYTTRAYNAWGAVWSYMKSDWYRTTSTYSATRSMTWWTFTTITARLTRYNLSRHPMTTFTIQEPYNFVPWGNERVYGYTFENFQGVGGRLYAHRHYANATSDANVTVAYGLKYMLNMTSMIDFLSNLELDSVAFAIEVTKGYMPYTTTTTTPQPAIVIKPGDCVKYGLILVGLALALLFLQTHRVLALFVTAAAALSILSYLHIRPDASIIVSWLNLEYIFELIFAMLLVAVTADTGLFDLVAFTIYKLCFGSAFGITCIMCASTFALTLFMDGVAVILFMTPLAIRCMEQGQLNPTPVLMSMILYCNMASVLDCDYNYVNHYMIKSVSKWEASEAAFRDVKLHQKMMPGVINAAAVTTLYLLAVFVMLKPHLYTNPEVASLVHRQTLLRILSSSANRNSKSWDAVRAQLIEWHHEIDQERLQRLMGDPPSTRRDLRKEALKNVGIRDKLLLMKLGIVMAIFIALMVLRRYKAGTISIGIIVVACMGYLLLLVNPRDMNTLFRRMQWSTIIAFLCLFFIAGALGIMRLNVRLFYMMKDHMLPEDMKSAFFQVFSTMQWGSFLFSTLFSNFGAITTLRSLGVTFGDIYPDQVADLVFAITFGCNVGGSATVIGTGVSIACLASAWMQGYSVSASKYMIFMLPVTLLNMLCVLATWHTIVQ